MFYCIWFLYRELSGINIEYHFSRTEWLSHYEIEERIKKASTICLGFFFSINIWF